MRVQPVILCGGSGTRLWPISRRARPKQFVPIFGGRSLLQHSLLRISSTTSRNFFQKHGYELSEKPICIGSEYHKFQILDEAEQAGIEIDCVFEPLPKNTAPAMAVIASLKAKEKKSILIFCPSDHYIENVEGYLQSLIVGLDEISGNEIFTLGIKPSFPSTAYGYIEVGAQLEKSFVYPVKRFIEKPNLEVATEIIREKNVFWNAGSFMMSVDTLNHVLNKYCPNLYRSACYALEKAEIVENKITLKESHFELCESISIDHAVMEKFRHLKVVELQADWSDIGSWTSLAKLFPPDSNENRSNSEETLFFDSKETFVYSSAYRPVVSVGLKDVFVVDTSDAVLIANNNCAETIKNVVAELENRSLSQAQHHRKVNRPWGTFDSIDSGERFKVKRISVKPGGRLSLQKHKKRAEHWVVIRGKAKVTRGNEVFELKENESTYIPIGVVHRLENPCDSELEIIEVQTGTYFGEDDIYRYEDEYGRKE